MMCSKDINNSHPLPLFNNSFSKLQIHIFQELNLNHQSGRKSNSSLFSRWFAIYLPLNLFLKRVLISHSSSLFAVTKFIRIGIADKNDNPPYFDKTLYEAEVDENEDIQHTVLTVTAKDHDECE